MPPAKRASYVRRRYLCAILRHFAWREGGAKKTILTERRNRYLYIDMTEWIEKVGRKTVVCKRGHPYNQVGRNINNRHQKSELAKRNER